MVKVSINLFSFCSLILIFLMPSLAWGRPVSFLQGWSLMNENRSYQNEAMVSFTVQRHLALGIHYTTLRAPENSTQQVLAPLANLLVFRWNDEGRQSNLYIGAGFGAMQTSGQRNRVKGTAVFNVDLDTETKDFSFAFRHEHIQSKSDRYLYSRVRAGLSPYLSNFGSLHTWVLLQGDWDHWRSEGEITPLLRFFFQNVLWEMGYSFRGRAQFNWSVEM
jgi:hypothetical protein